MFWFNRAYAGSDAGGLTSEGVVFKDTDGELKIRFNWNKRWITLSGISMVIGLAFLLKIRISIWAVQKNMAYMFQSNQYARSG